MTLPCPIYLLTRNGLVDEEILCYVGSPYEAKKRLADLAVFHAKPDIRDPFFYGAEPSGADLKPGQSITYLVHANPGNEGHAYDLKRQRCLESGIIRSVPVVTTERVATFRIQTVAPFDADTMTINDESE